MDRSLKQCRSQGVRSAMVRVCAAILVLGSTQAGFAQQAVAAKPAAVAAVSPQTAAVSSVAKPAAEEEEQTAHPSKPASEGIKVHGHWVLDIKNPDGTLVKHLDFENSLVGPGYAISGSQLLALLISGNVTPSDPAIGFVPTAQYTSATDATTMCPNLLAEQCALLTTSESFYSNVSTGSFLPSAFNAQTGLHAVVTVGPAVNWVLSGNFTVPSGLTSISAVQTLLSVCLPSSSNVLQNYAVTDQLTGSYSDRNADISSSACKVGLASTPSETELYFPLTSTTVPNAPLLVTPQQIVTVSVGSDNGVLAVKDSAGNSPQTVALTGDGIFSPDFETIHITDLLSLVPSTLVPPDVEVIHITDQLSLVSSTLLPINEVLHVSDEVQQSTATGSQTTPTVTWPAASAIVYGTPLSAMQLNATAPVAGTFVYSPAGGKVLGAGTQELTATFTPANTAMYATVVSSMPLTVLPAPMTVAISSYSRAFATANPAFSYSIGGYVNGDTSAAVSGAPVLSTTAVLHSPAGSYAINGTIGTLSAANYSFSFVPGTLTVLGGATQTILGFQHIPNMPLAVGHITVTAHSTSGSLGQPIVFSATGPATVSGNTVTFTGTGAVTVTANEAGNATFNAAMPIPQTFTVTP